MKEHGPMIPLFKARTISQMYTREYQSIKNAEKSEPPKTPAKATKDLFNSPALVEGNFMNRRFHDQSSKT